MIRSLLLKWTQQELNSAKNVIISGNLRELITAQNAESASLRLASNQIN
jgi:hypothetical protein